MSGRGGILRRVARDLWSGCRLLGFLVAQGHAAFVVVAAQDDDRVLAHQILRGLKGGAGGAGAGTGARGILLHVTQNDGGPTSPSNVIASRDAKNSGSHPRTYAPAGAPPPAKLTAPHRARLHFDAVAHICHPNARIEPELAVHLPVVVIPNRSPTSRSTLVVNARLIPTGAVWLASKALKTGAPLYHSGGLVGSLRGVIGHGCAPS